MTHIRDLEPCHYLDLLQLPLIAVGWLESERQGSPGAVPDDVRLLLGRQIAEAVEFCSFRGVHRCTLCQPGQGTAARQGVVNCIVPGHDALYACPELILHYIDEHQYCPPDEFLQAVREAPRQGSDEYYERMLQAGGDRAEHGLAYMSVHYMHAPRKQRVQQAIVRWRVAGRPVHSSRRRDTAETT